MKRPTERVQLPAGLTQAHMEVTMRTQADSSLTTPSEKRKLAVLMRMALTYADAAGAEPDAVKRAQLLDLCMTCWRQAQLLRRWPGIPGRA
jgi:hypothetical protein